MRNLWRVLAIAWLGGVASPGLAEELMEIDTSAPMSIASEPAATNSAIDGEPGEVLGHSAGTAARQSRS